MKMKKALCVLIAAVTVTGTSAFAKDNIYAYNKFVSTVLGPQVGYCDFAASFAGHENEYDNVNDYFSGLISAYYDDIDGDFDNELVTVDTHGVTVYRGSENGVVFLGSLDVDMIANYGDSYANVFSVAEKNKKYTGVEVYGKTANEYHMYLYDLNPDTDEFKKILEISREDNEDGTEENVWANGKTYYSYTNGGGLQTSINPEGYTSCANAGYAALRDTVPSVNIDADELKRMTEGALDGDNFRFEPQGVSLKTYIRATGLRFTERPVVMFEDRSQLSTLSVKPDIVTVVIDGQTIQFPTQDPVIVEERTLVPMRTIFEALGAEVDWQKTDGVQTITATTEDTIINMTIDSKEYFVNGEGKELDVPPQLMNDKTMVPIRAISESLGCYVGWDQDSKTVIIQSHI